MKLHQKYKPLFIGTICTSILIGLGVMIYTVGNNSLNSLSANTNQNQSYELNLNSANKVTSNGDHIQKTGLNNNVTFTYSGVSNSTTGHVTLNNGGKLVNKDHILSIESLTINCSVENSLSLKISYDGSSWGASGTVTSGYTFDLTDTKPYYFELTASKSVTISSIHITYSCAANPDAGSGEGLIGVIDFWDQSNISDTSTTAAVDVDYVQNRSYASVGGNSKNLVSSVSNVSNCYQDRYGGIGMGSNNNKGTIKLYFANSVEPSKVTIELVAYSSTSASFSVNGTSKNIGNHTYSSSMTSSTYASRVASLEWTFNEAPSYINLESNKGSGKAGVYRIYLYGSSTPVIDVPVEPTDLSIQSELELIAGASKTLDITYIPSEANRNLGATWESSNTNVATVENGVITVKNSATVGQTATITATLDRDNTKTSQCVVTVVEEQKDAYTIMIYMCGSDLESGGEDDYGEYDADYYGGYASEDIKEILSISGQPEDVNIIIETGGAGAWASTYDIKNDMLGRWEIKNKSLINVDYLSNASMGEKNTFKSFLEWGLTDYPAEKTAVILWNHGGAMRGACYDENFNKNSLLVSETTEAFKEVLGDNKLEWIGYDCCLMQVQDIAEQNSKYFKYMVASEESEAGYGWEYNTWIDDVYAGHDIDTTLTAICDGFVNSYNGSGNDQTLSYLDLSKINKYYTAWEDMSDSLYDLINSYGKTNFQNLMKTVKEYGTTIYTASQLTQAGYSTNPSSQNYFGNYGIVQIGNKYYDYGYTYFGIFDAADFLNKISNIDAFNDAQNEIDSVLEAINELIVYNKIGGSAGNSNGLCMYFPLGRWCQIETYYQKNVQTNFVKWWKIVNDFGINS